MTKYLTIFKALFKGRALLNIKTWKNVQMVATILSGIAFTILEFFPDLVVDSEVIEGAVMAIAYAGSAVALYLTPATTEKIGFGNETDSNSDDGTVSDELPSFQPGAGEVQHPSNNQGANGLR